MLPKGYETSSVTDIQNRLLSSCIKYDEDYVYVKAVGADRSLNLYLPQQRSTKTVPIDDPLLSIKDLTADICFVPFVDERIETIIKVVRVPRRSMMQGLNHNTCSAVVYSPSLGRFCEDGNPIPDAEYRALYDAVGLRHPAYFYSNSLFLAAAMSSNYVSKKNIGKFDPLSTFAASGVKFGVAAPSVMTKRDEFGDVLLVNPDGAAVAKYAEGTLKFAQQYEYMANFFDKKIKL